VPIALGAHGDIEAVTPRIKYEQAHASVPAR
jgi:hypothetical protein